MPAAVARKRYDPEPAALEADAPAPGARPSGRPPARPGGRSRASAPARRRDIDSDIASPLMPLAAPRPAAPAPLSAPPRELTAEARQVARRARRGHRPLRWSWVTGPAAILVMGQLVVLLWVMAMGTAAGNRAWKLDQEIDATRDSIAQTQEHIASFDASGQLDQWAGALGMHQAEQSEFDDVSRPEPLNGAADGQQPAGAAQQTVRAVAALPSGTPPLARVDIEVAPNQAAPNQGGTGEAAR